MGENTNEDMRKLTISISDNLDDRLRKYVDDNYDGLKGGLSIVVGLALKEFLDKTRKV